MKRVLRLGSRGSDVRGLQEALAIRGYDPGPLDGVFGPLTQAAVEAFQRDGQIQVDGVVGPETRHAMEAATAPAPAAAPPAHLTDGVLPDAATSVWIHRLDNAIERAGGVAELAQDLVDLGVEFALVKVADGRSLMNQRQLGAAITALRAAGVRVILWQWVYAVYYSAKTGRPETPYHGSVEYLADQARVLADQCRRHACTAIACANMEGGGAFSTGSSKKLVFGPRNIALFGSQKAADEAIAERVDAYAQVLDAELPGVLTICSTHGDPSTQRMPWVTMCRAFAVIGAQLYNPGKEGWRKRVARTCGLWHKHGARRIRVSGPAWKQGRTTKPAWVGQLAGELHAGTGGADVDRGADWWVYELMTPQQRAELLRVAA